MSICRRMTGRLWSFRYCPPALASLMECRLLSPLYAWSSGLVILCLYVRGASVVASSSSIQRPFFYCRNDTNGSNFKKLWCSGGTYQKKNYICLNNALNEYDQYFIILKENIMCAKIKFGMFMTDARGKVGGQVFSKNRGGAYVRTKVTPSNGQTARQSFVRQLLGSISQSWSSLSQSARDGFDNAVSQWSNTDIFGDIRNPTGKNLFTKLNINLANSGQDQIILVPTKEEMPLLTASAVKNIAGVMTISDIVAEPLATLVVSATAPQSAGTNFFRGKYRQIAAYKGSDVETENLATGYNAKFGVPAVTANISFELKWVLANGQASTPIYVKMTI